MCCSSWHERRKLRSQSVFVLGLVIEAGVDNEGSSSEQLLSRAEEWQVRAAQKGRRVVGRWVGRQTLGAKGRQVVALCSLCLSFRRQASDPPKATLAALKLSTVHQGHIKLTSTRHSNFILSSPDLFKINHMSARRAHLGESSSYDSYPRLPLYPTYTYSSLNRNFALPNTLLDRISYTGSNGLYSAIRYTKPAGTLGPYRLSKPPNTVVAVWLTRTLSCGQWCQSNAGPSLRYRSLAFD